MDLKYPISYAQREIIVRPTPGLERKSMTKINEPLFPQPKQLLLDKDSRLELPDCQQEPLVLQVPDTPITPVNASTMHFGMATTLDRLADSTPSIERWLAHTSAKLFVVIITPPAANEEANKTPQPPTPKQLSTRQSQLRKRGMDITLLPPLTPTESYTETYFSLIRILHSHRHPETQWHVLMDDDTFFPSLRALLATLSPYPPNQEYWIGALSETWWSVARYGMMAFGGAGIFLSRALAETLDTHYDSCTGEMHPAAGGDERVMRCIYNHTDTKLTNLERLHQMDLGGDLSGVYENGKFPLSLHHWKTDNNEYPVDKMSLISDICGECFLQRWLFSSSDNIVLANGFSIAQYPGGGTEGIEWDRPEETWESRTVEESVNEGVWHSLGMAREAVKEKVVWRLVDAGVVGGEGERVVRQVYLRRGKEEGKEEGDAVFVLYWRREEDVGKNTKSA
ncbi:hypothetical protein Q9189_002367 [Teloschistes chrysophthalmus]